MRTVERLLVVLVLASTAFAGCQLNPKEVDFSEDAVSCLADCEGKKCGDDGCGGTCGECAAGYQCISGSCGIIGCAQPSDCPVPPNLCAHAACENGTCLQVQKPPGQSCGQDMICSKKGECINLECTESQPCEPHDKPCKVYLCEAGECILHDRGDGVECGADGDGRVCNRAVCVNKCTAACDGKECGEFRGCACGQECPSGKVCLASGQCTECAPATCESMDYECGNWMDGCEGHLDCGECQSGQTCIGGGKCLPDFPTGTNSPCEVSASAGCSDPNVVACVCAVEPHCCTFKWDMFCVAAAQKHCEVNSCAVSCFGNCKEGVAAGNCYCDAECTHHEDCCPDFCYHCANVAVWACTCEGYCGYPVFPCACDEASFSPESTTQFGNVIPSCPDICNHCGGSSFNQQCEELGK